MKGAWFQLGFHTTVETSLLFVAVLFYSFVFGCFHCFIRSLRKLDGNCVQLVVLVAIGTIHPWGVRLV